MANFEAIAQRVFEENCVERWVMLVEVLGTFNILGRMRSEQRPRLCHTKGGLGAAKAIRVAVGRALGSAKMVEGIVERTHGIRIANPQIDVTEQRKRICFKITQTSLVRAGAIFREVYAVRVGAVMV